MVRVPCIPAAAWAAAAAQAFQRHGVGGPARNPRRSASAPWLRPAAASLNRPPTLDAVFVELNPGALPGRER
jgi:hypothetical protein